MFRQLIFSEGKGFAGQPLVVQKRGSCIHMIYDRRHKKNIERSSRPLPFDPDDQSTIDGTELKSLSIATIAKPLFRYDRNNRSRPTILKRSRKSYMETIVSMGSFSVV